MAQKYKSKWTGPQVDSAVDQITDKIDRSEIGVAGGIASLGSDGKVPSWQLPTVKDVTVDNFIGKDGITINKAADSEKIEISGSGCVQSYTKFNDEQVYMTRPNHSTHTMENGVTRLATYSIAMVSGSIPVYFDSNKTQNIPSGVLITGTPTQESHATNKKYVDDNYVKKTTRTSVLYGVDAGGTQTSFLIGDLTMPAWSIPQRVSNGSLRTPTPVNDLDCTNKKYVDDAIAAGTGTLQFKTLFGNQNIVGQGNIDLYKHHVKLTSTSAVFTGDYYTDIISSQNFAIDSLTDLKTYLGDSFTKDIYGALESNNTYRFGCFMTPTAVYYLDTDGAPKSQLISNFTISDTITTI